MADILSNSYDLAALEGNTTYYWKVGSLNVCNQVNWSETWSFTTSGISGIGDMSAINKIKFYPNPASNILYFYGIEDEITSISILSLEGKLLKFVNKAGLKELDISDIKQGVYLLKVVNSKNSISKMLVIQKK